MTVEDELSAPLGQHRSPERPFPLSGIAVAAVGVLSVAFFAWTVFATRGSGPMGVAPINPTPATLKAVEPVALPQRGETAPQAQTDVVELPRPPAGRTVTIIDGTSGKRQEIIIPETTGPASADPPPASLPRQSRKSTSR